MSIIDEKYHSLPPKGEKLCDFVVLAQAWKKTHTYMRRHNWYADVLELDASTIDLENHLEDWQEEISRPDFTPDDLRLVPAPKNSRWWFPGNGTTGADPQFGDWTPSDAARVGGSSEKSSDESPNLKLRPLAHMSIRDQTFATAVMMCLAEAVESAQGDTTCGDSKVVSYGNRLCCTWKTDTDTEKSRAQFPWGNSKTYNQYFSDYRAFLARPRRICAELAHQQRPGCDLFIISLDIRSFFDNIDRAALIKELKALQEHHQNSYNLPDSERSDSKFWEISEKIFAWKWSSKDQKYHSIFGENENVNLGLPQGMVASGFFANAYLIKFDHKMQELASGAKDIGDDVRLLDYCRYVDDMRLVVEAKTAPTGEMKNNILKLVNKCVGSALKKHCQEIGANKTLGLSPEKSTATPYQAISAQRYVSALMEMINSELSGTFDLESLAQVAGGLDGLLHMSEQIESTPPPQPSRLSLAIITVPNTDVRDDTVKRFVAARLAKSMRERLAMTALDSPADSGAVIGEQVTQGMLLSHEFEATARKLIKCWAENPALVSLLRCGLGLFPHPYLLDPVIEALSVKLFSAPDNLTTFDRQQVCVAEYVLTDLLRAGATETGFLDPEEYPDGVDIHGYRENLRLIARRVLSDRPDSPWFLCQQAYLYLASIGDTSMCEPSEISEELKRYVALHRAAQFKRVQNEELRFFLPLAIVMQAMQPNPQRFCTWLSQGLRSTTDSMIRRYIVQILTMTRPDLLIAALNGQRASNWRMFVPSALIHASKRPRSTRKRPARLEGPRLLLNVTSETNNLFNQENALLMLADALLNYPEIEKHLANGANSGHVNMHCNDWSKLSQLPTQPNFLHVISIETENEPHPLYACPPWVAPHKAWLYGLGRILRSALTGEFDFTSSHYLVTEDVGPYSGLRTTGFKRRFSLVNSGRALLDEPGPISPWLSSLLSTLLQWPGIEHRDNAVSAAGNVRNATELRAIIQNRIAEQRKLFGHRSKTPIYIIPVNNHEPPANRALRVAIVQPMRPRRGEFSTSNPTYWTSRALAEHRRHLAEICNLARQTINTRASAKPGSAEADAPVVDIILFPELAVHWKDVDLLKRLSDAVGATIFTGLTFLHSNKAGGVVNQGLWLIRTQSQKSGRSFQYVLQGKQHPIPDEIKLGVIGYRPYINLVEFPVGTDSPTRIAAAICYDATDLDLAADLRNTSDMFLVAALNQDVKTFDNMVAALHFHMYQPVVLANSGEFGGSTAQVPLRKHEQLIAHVHGNEQIAVSVFEIDPSPFKSTSVPILPKMLKTPPAGYSGRR